jgi:hypothetical protein
MYASGTQDIANFGTDDFTIDFWVRFAAISSQMMYDGRGAGGDVVPVIYVNTASGNVLEYFVGGTLRQSTAAVVANTWYHVAVTRTAGVTGRLFVNGVQQGASFGHSHNMPSVVNRPLIGADLNGSTNQLNGWLEELRITRGKARWTANFTPPAAPYS